MEQQTQQKHQYSLPMKKLFKGNKPVINIPYYDYNQWKNKKEVCFSNVEDVWKLADEWVKNNNLTRQSGSSKGVFPY